MIPMDANKLEELFEKMDHIRVPVSLGDKGYAIEAKSPLQYRLSEMLGFPLWLQEQSSEIPLSRKMEMIEQKLEQIKPLLASQPGGPAEHSLVWGIPKSQ